ncbi:MAG: ParB/RepB/Spo0J family partition protein [Candidatus Cloacimonetes bacterium]|jgi:ParB family transcriptional regulator, chromosome partitioning protein|nr:ParB/RepB/Spo0J family partition protein [Candidatus Cloacimonadota bacterium]MBT5420590.1 ParB/RepB/Spo0J family partition protein [Candidatus Cloacimonadota bacterium]
MTKLGKGLEALISAVPESTDISTGITTIKTDQIKPNRYQPRKQFNNEKLQELANSLKENGIIQPIIVTTKDEGEYELIAGERRLEASKLAGFSEIPVIIRSVSPKEQLQFAIIENVQREDLTAIEEAKAYQQLNEEFKLTHAQISEIVGKDRATITNFIRLLKLSGDVQMMILNEQISSGHARAILQVDEELRDRFSQLIIKNKLSVRKAEEEAKRIKETGTVSPSKKKKEVIEIPELKEFEKNLKQKFNSKVKISDNNYKGKVSFYYSSQDELNKLLEKLEK